MSEELKPCPFCGGEARRGDVPGEEDIENAGASYIECTKCAASTALHFDRKENLVSSWNDRASLSQAGEPVAVIPLEWSWEPPYSVARVFRGHYSVEGHEDGASLRGTAGCSEWGSVSEAKAAAQADYERRVRSCLVSAPPAAPAAEVDAPSPAARDVLAERRRQIESEGWTPEHDDKHSDGAIAMAAATYAISHLIDAAYGRSAYFRLLWPWHQAWWKPNSRRRDLVRAGALIVAEIERLDRAADTSQKEG